MTTTDLPRPIARADIRVGDRITTIEEMDALPEGSVVLDRDGLPLWRYPAGMGGWCAANGTRDIEWPEMESDGAPFTLLHVPGRDLIREAKAEAWEEGREAEVDYARRQEDADAAGQFVRIPYPRNPHRAPACPTCGCAPRYPTATHVMDYADQIEQEGETRG